MFTHNPLSTIYRLRSARSPDADTPKRRPADTLAIPPTHFEHHETQGI
jgi:hypothetical protein